MLKAVLPAAFACLLLASSPDPVPPCGQDSRFILSCEAFPGDLTQTALIQRFGAANVVAGQITGMEDGPRPGTLLFPTDSSLRVEIEWLDPESKRRPNWILVKGDSSRWRTADRISLGSDLRTLERLNGRPFRLAGFHTEIAGIIQSWGGGRSARPVTAGCGLVIKVSPRPEDTDPAGPAGQVSLGTDYSSGHPAMQRLNPRVVAITLLYGRG